MNSSRKRPFNWVWEEERTQDEVGAGTEQAKNWEKGGEVHRDTPHPC